MSDVATTPPDTPKEPSGVQSSHPALEPVGQTAITPVSRAPDVELQQLVSDAVYVVEAVARNDTGKGKADTVSDADIKAINCCVEVFYAKGTLTCTERTDLEVGLAHVLRALTPVTVQSLKDTDPRILRRSPWLFLNRTYEAKWLSHGLMFATLVFVTIAVAGDVFIRYYGPPLDRTEGVDNLIGLLFQALIPFTYGGVGACVYLLRSLHTYIYERTYDQRRTSEYVNRVLLGAVSGGAVVLLIEQVTSDSGAVVHFSSAALGFLAGYNTDFLFTAIERISAAILPKINLESVRRRDDDSRNPPPSPVNLSDLLVLFQNAKTPEERAIIKGTIERLYPGIKVP